MALQFIVIIYLFILLDKVLDSILFCNLSGACHILNCQ